ncbi:NAD(P)/FAD-dependent oxidoreductase [Cognatiyoonia sp. IB215446]|uniref:NAD(P)/FAD-dependent oxidoreductase n=1 Tax=Cognatiyoonia sp. IB215446 TaxID=3097355 RepID=UPI002A13C5F6|nr:NAD(P)/FAD-dependent oxidoreductase [Cognatiyoonia sp. IB215446]MDX8350455.1 NAD(P)/FAD-dependent oxidoreductase [Cognatiyoonia sp. IB215446]
MSTPKAPIKVDVAIVGGSFAGLSAALPLARMRRQIALFDHEVTRNRFASASHGFLGQDGSSPNEIRATGRRELSVYPTAQVLKEKVESVIRKAGAFRLETDQGTSLDAKRLILATGQRDLLPDIPGLADCWGQSVLQCPYCHGYELQDRPTALLHVGEASFHQARILPHLTDDLVYLTNGVKIPDDQRADLGSIGYRIEERSIRSLKSSDGLLSNVEFADGAFLSRQALYLITTSQPASDLADQLGCQSLDGPFGPFLEVDEMQQTSVRYVYAAGDIGRPAYNATWAAADGARAGVFAHQSLVVDQNPYQGNKV